jgi:REP element-mobilizing transposase RayT
LRIEYAGAIYHVMSRGKPRKDIFRDAQDRKLFLSLLGESCQKTEWRVLAYCLMRDHFHLVLETPQPNLVPGMKWLLGVYTQCFNARHCCRGHLFAGRYKALLVDGRGGDYLRTVCDYVHLNPARAGIIRPGAPLESFRWSSYAAFLQPAKARPPWLRVERLLGKRGIRADSAAGRREFARQIERQRADEDEADYRGIRRGWCLGSAAFRRQLRARVRQLTRSKHFGAECQEIEERKAERIVREELRRRGWTKTDLRRRHKGDEEKVKIARRVRGETTAGLQWVAQRLQMGTWNYVSNLMRQP